MKTMNLIHDVPMTVTFVSETKHYGFAARNDTGASCYISPMLAEQVGLDRNSAGRVLTGTLATNTDDHGGQATSTTPWRVMSWSRSVHSQPVQGRGVIAELTDALRQIEQLRDQLATTLARLE